MKQSIFIGLVALSPFLSLEALRPDASVHFDEAGFSIDILDEALSDNTSQRIMMLLPPSGGFASNVNVQTQPFTGTIEEYAAISRAEFKEMEFELIEESYEGEFTWLVEYTGGLNGDPFHWFSKATKAGEHVYLATGTAAESAWGDVSDQLEECVESLIVDQVDK